MTPEKLNYLLVLAEEQNLTRASKRLFITQPTLTVFINRLENELGVHLFDRTKNPVRLTRSGQIYIDKMKKLVLEEQQLIDELKNHESPQNRIVIGIGQIHSEIWCPDLVTALVKKYPLLNVQVKENQEAVLMEHLRNSEVDLFMGHTVIDTVNFVFEELCIEDLILLFPKNLLSFIETDWENNSFQNPYILEPSMLRELPIISPSSSQGLYLNNKQFFSQHHINPKRQIMTANMVTAASMVGKGLGYMYGSSALLKKVEPKLRKNIVFCTLPHLPNSRKFYAGYSDTNPNIEIIMDIIRIMKDEVV